MNRTALHPEHLKAGAKMTDFHGWDMPLYYTSILEEHACVRNAVGLFDISHMGQVLVSGAGAMSLLNGLCVSDVTQVGESRACYTMLVNEQGRILDDIIIYRVGSQDYLVIVNCANREKDYAWLTQHQDARTEIRPVSDGRSMIAIQGPRSSEVIEQVLGIHVDGLARFSLMPLNGQGPQAWMARTGYTGSDGFEVFLTEEPSVRLWQRLLQEQDSVGVQPVGLGARDTLRLEAGLRLYGTDMDDTTTPYEADLGWTVAINKPSFLGKAALAQQKTSGVSKRLVGFELAEGPVPRHGFPLLIDGRQVGQVTSGTFSPMLAKPIGMGYVDSAVATVGTILQITIRSKTYPATIVKLPFWRARPPKPDMTKHDKESAITKHQIPSAK